MKKTLKIALLTIAFVTILAAVVAVTLTPMILSNTMERWISDAITRDIGDAAPSNVIIGDVSVELTGKIIITHLVVANLPGYSAPYALKIDKLSFKLHPWNLFTGGVYDIDSLTISEPSFILEVRQGVSNLDALLKFKDNVSLSRENRGKRFNIHNITILDGSLEYYNSQRPAIITAAWQGENVVKRQNIRDMYARILEALRREVVQKSAQSAASKKSS